MFYPGSRPGRREHGTGAIKRPKRREVLMAGSVLISLPIIVLFFVAERFLTEGLTAGGVKG